MIGKEQSKRLTITVSSGSGTGTVENEWSIARWIRVVPPDESATYSLDLRDADGHMMASRNNCVGTFSEQLEMSLGILSTVNITSASVDGSWVAKFDMN